MPWSPLKYTDQIFQRLKSMGDKTETTTNNLHRVIMLETKLIRSKTIGNLIEAFKMLGYIESKNGITWRIRYWRESKTNKMEVMPIAG